MPAAPVSAWSGLTTPAVHHLPISGDDRCIFGSWLSFSKSCCQLLTTTCLGASYACFRAGPSEGTTVSADAFQKNSWDTVQSGTEVAAVLPVPNMKNTSKFPSVTPTVCRRPLQQQANSACPISRHYWYPGALTVSAREVMSHLIISMTLRVPDNLALARQGLFCVGSR